MVDNGQDIEVENVNAAIIPTESEQDFLRRVWIEALGEMLGETRSRWEDAFRTVKSEAAAAVAELRADAAELPVRMEAMIAKRLAQIRQPIDGKEGSPGERGEKGERGEPGYLPMVRQWTENEISYRGDVVIYDGGTWQAQKDTAQRPSFSQGDWLPLAVAGRIATSPVVRGTFDIAQSYDALNIVALNGSAFIAKHSDPGECPGGGWQLNRLVRACGQAWAQGRAR